MKIGLLSDTHGYLDDAILKHFENCDEIWHIGDFGSMEVIEKLESTPRVVLVEANKGLGSTAEIMECARDLGRPRSDLNEIAVWKESLNIKDGELFYMQAIHQESDVVPENVDCIRAMLEMEEDPAKSIEKTNKNMGIM